jgi:hypothetical protein
MTEPDAEGEGGQSLVLHDRLIDGGEAHLRMAYLYADKRMDQPWWDFWSRFVLWRTERVHRRHSQSLFDRAWELSQNAGERPSS